MSKKCSACNGTGKVQTTTDQIFYNNPENLSSYEISRKMACLSYGNNRSKRLKILESYNTEKITKEQFINFFTTK